MNKHTRKTLVLAVVVGLAAWAAPAVAELNLLVDVNKTKDVNVDVNITITKDIDVTIDVVRAIEGTAEAQANLNVENKFNVVGPCLTSCFLLDTGGPNLDDFGVESDADLLGSIVRNEGIVGVNQDVGNMVNQANVLGLARAEWAEGSPGDTVADAEAEIDQENFHNFVAEREVLPDLPDDPTAPSTTFNDPDHTATIKDSITFNNGVVGVNQNSGSVNNQSNGVAFAIGEGNVVVLTEASLGQVNSANVHVGIETAKIDLISGSINNNNGIVSVNQSSGNMNNQGVSVAFGALATTASVGVPGS